MAAPRSMRAKATARPAPPAPTSTAALPSRLARPEPLLEVAAEADAVRVVALRPARRRDGDGVDGADLQRLGRHLVEQRDHRLLARKGDVDTVEAGGPYGGDQVLPRPGSCRVRATGEPRRVPRRREFRAPSGSRRDPRGRRDRRSRWRQERRDIVRAAGGPRRSETGHSACSEAGGSVTDEHQAGHAGGCRRDSARQRSRQPLSRRPPAFARRWARGTQAPR